MRHQEKQSALLMDINRMNKPNNIVYRRKNTESCTHQESFSYSASEANRLLALDKQIWMVPIGRNSEFVGREDILLELSKRLIPKQDCVARAALWGLGGVG
jgi:hypothetical protein